MTRLQPNTRVLIVEDCRPGVSAVGQIGVYEGDFPFTVLVNWSGQVFEFDYQAWTSGEIKFSDGVSGVRHVREWVKGQPQPESSYWFSVENPRIRLPDGSAIWGAECWFTAAQDGTSLSEAQGDLAQVKAVLRTISESVSQAQVEEENVDAK